MTWLMLKICWHFNKYFCLSILIRWIKHDQHSNLRARPANPAGNGNKRKTVLGTKRYLHLLIFPLPTIVEKIRFSYVHAVISLTSSLLVFSPPDGWDLNGGLSSFILRLMADTLAILYFTVSRLSLLTFLTSNTKNYYILPFVWGSCFFSWMRV